MNSKTDGKLHNSRLQGLLVGAALVVGLGLAAPKANASIVGTVGGAPTGAGAYENFDTVPLGSASFTTPSGIKVSFTSEGQAVQGRQLGRYAAPFLSGGNGLNFGDIGTQSDGENATIYLASGATGSSVTLAFAGPTHYMGLLWGSVDAYNKLTFYTDNGATKVGEFTGTDVTALAHGDQGANGTFYVNINLSDSFTSVVATSSTYSFEFDNVAISATPLKVPEPAVTGFFLLGLLLVGSAYWLKGRRLA